MNGLNNKSPGGFDHPSSQWIRDGRQIESISHLELNNPPSC